MANILIVEDDIDIAQGIAEYLEAKGHLLDFAYNGKQAMALLSDNHYELVLLDLNLPFIDGLDVCRSLLTEQLTTMPVIIMSARTQEKDILAGFDCGAWDYLTKPFSFAELSARVGVCLAKSASTSQIHNNIEVGEACLNCDNLSFEYAGTTLQLHQLGFDLLKLLMNKSPATVKTADIHKELWPQETPDSDPLRAHIYKLRKQLKTTFGQEFIATIRGVGYRFQLEQPQD
ncbi:response regulator transcription factor [Shewanella submarina]|uniref:Response regulator transcription factor n=1 Tax=Shewanella submarina TaxID=2016376 RepID=A0ABV7GJ48_9GAMM|nr:response regulator transcription factor [Shewanella submarina]MCL1035885.1 response regulator transcription factor [Shewanella submarina]